MSPTGSAATATAAIATALLSFPGPVVADVGLRPNQTIDIHFQPPSYIGCSEAAVSDAALSCGTLDDTYRDHGPSTPNFAWVVVGGVEDGTGPGAPGGIGGLQFGIDIDPGFVIRGWTLCTGGDEIPEVGWPKSGRGNAVTWSGGCRLVTDNGDGLTRVGFLVLQALDEAMIRVTGDPRIGYALVVECDGSQGALCRELLGYGGTDGVGHYTACGDACLVREPARETSWGALRALY